MEWFILFLICLILVAVAAVGYTFGRGAEKPDADDPARAGRVRRWIEAGRRRLRIGRSKGETERFIAWITSLPGVDEAFKVWLESLPPGEVAALVQSATGFCSDLKAELVWLLDWQMADDLDLKREVEEAVVLYCQACWKAVQVREGAKVFEAFLAWQNTPPEHRELSQRLFAKLVETGSIPVPPELYLVAERERRSHGRPEGRDVRGAAQTAISRLAGETAPPASRRDEARDRDAHRAARITSLRLPRESAPSADRGAGEAVLSMVERVIFLKEVPLFESMTIEQLQILAEVSEESDYDEGEIIVAEGDTGDALYVIVSGRVSIEQTGGQNGAVAHVGTRSNRQYFGELAIFDEEPRSASVIALEPTLLLSLRRAPLVALIGEDSHLALELIRVLSLRLREAHRQVAEQSVPVR